MFRSDGMHGKWLGLGEHDLEAIHLPPQLEYASILGGIRAQGEGSTNLARASCNKASG